MDILANLDLDKFCLGRICSKGHEWKGTGKSLRYKYDNKRRPCVECKKEESRKRGKYYKSHYQKNKERINRNIKEWQNLHKEKVNKIQIKYRESEKGKQAAIKASHRRRATKMMNHKANYSREQLAQVKEAFGNQCAYCGSEKDLQIDHFIAVANGGSDCIGNFVIACKECNRKKWSADPMQWYKNQPFYSVKRWKRLLKLLGKTELNYNQMPLF